MPPGDIITNEPAIIRTSPDLDAIERRGLEAFLPSATPREALL
jgi:hypothetical protein